MSDDQRALLRLLAQREEGYEDIAALMGLSVDEVRRRVKDALAGLDEGAPATGVDESSQAAGPVAAGNPPPPPVAEASSGEVPPAPPPAADEVASTSSSAKPAAEASKPTPTRAPAATVSRQAKTKPQLSMPRDRRRLIELIGGAVVVILVLLFATGAIDIGGDDDSDSGSETTAARDAVNTDESGATKLTQAILEPVDGGDAEGLAVFGRSKGAVLLLLQAEGLAPSGKGEAYAVSLSRSPQERIPIAVTRVPQSGTIEGQYPVPSEALGLLANGFDQMEISLVASADLKAALAEAGKERKAPSYDGEDILRGDVTGPIVNIAAKEGEG